jgi:hypothetical protein
VGIALEPAAPIPDKAKSLPDEAYMSSFGAGMNDAVRDIAPAQIPGAKG